MKVWVTGAKGMLGRAVMERLARFEVPHVGSGRDDVDVTDTDQVHDWVARHAPSHIVNCAAFTRVDEAETARESAFSLNASGPEVLGRAATSVGAAVIHYSTDHVFSGTKSAPYHERDEPAPVNVYGHSKLAGERKLRDACPASWVVRTSWLFGEGGTNFVATMLRLMGERRTVEVVDDQHGRPTYAPDLAEASLALAGVDPSCARVAEPGIYHFANTGQVSRHAFAVAALEAARRGGFLHGPREILPVATDDLPHVAARPRFAVLDTRRIEHALGSTPRPFTAALDDFLAKHPEVRDERGR